MKKYIFLFLFYSVIAELSAQTISGTVYDLQKNEFIPNANIELKNIHNGLSSSIISDYFGKWEFDFTVLTVDDNNLLPDELTLFQNYPNPFNPSTRIQFQIREAGNVEFSIHSILGERIDYATAFLNSGNYALDWNANAAAGVYLYTLKSGKRSITKKMILLDGGKGKGFSNFISLSNSKSNNLSKSNASTDLEIIISKYGYVADTIYAAVSGGEQFESKIELIHYKAILVDLHNDVLEIMIDDPSYRWANYNTKNHTDLPRMKIGGIDIQFFSVWVSPGSYPTNAYEVANQLLDIFESEVFVNSASIEQAGSYDQAMSVVANNKIAGVIGVEGGHAIENSLEKLTRLYNRGMRYMTITWNNSTDWAISASDSRTNSQGLSEFGREVISKMDSLGVIIDVSHVGIQTIKDILTITNNPIIASHSGARALLNRYRNLYDWQIQDIANSGGVIGIVFYPPFLGANSNSVDIETVIDHIDYIVNLVGINHVSLGSDFDGIGTNTVNGLENTSKFPDLTWGLLNRGYSRDDIELILGGNFLRVFKKVCN
ncbi:MAG: membrane dipeptidase [Bacteroidota bacterium]